MAYLLKKRGKFFEGHDYCNIRFPAYRFFWTFKESEARRFPEDLSYAQHFADMTGATIIKTPNTKHELKAMGRRAMEAKLTQSQHA